MTTTPDETPTDEQATEALAQALFAPSKTSTLYRQSHKHSEADNEAARAFFGLPANNSDD